MKQAGPPQDLKDILGLCTHLRVENVIAVIIVLNMLVVKHNEAAVEFMPIIDLPRGCRA